MCRYDRHSVVNPAGLGRRVGLRTGVRAATAAPAGETAAVGIVDAVSVLGLGRVFVASMTGNVVFLGFAAAGVPGFALVASPWQTRG